jgi:predicted ATPase
MITHLFLDNYRCFTNFEWKPQEVSLLLGDNGVGKSSVFDVIETLRDFVVTGKSSMEAFLPSSLTAWDKRREQVFELGLKGNGGEYRYRLEVQFDVSRLRNRTLSEEVSFDGTVLYRFTGTEANLYRDDGTRGPEFPFDWSRSAIATIPAGKDNTKLTWFRERLARVHVIAPRPHTMSAVAEAESEHMARDAGDFPAWLRHLINDFNFAPRLTAKLAEVIDGFSGMQFISVNESAKRLIFRFKFNDAEFSLPFDKLSDGQRCLAVLYAAIATKDEIGSTLLWDEPDNFVSLREIDPWLRELTDLDETQRGQSIIISHHPELINALAVENGHTMFRDNNGTCRIKRFQWENGEVEPAELVARGWDD